MPLEKSLMSIAKMPDLLISKVYLKLFHEKNSLSIFLFHGLYQNESEKSLNLVDPQNWVTVEQFNQFVKYFVELGYRFVSPDDIIAGLKSDNRYIMVTFDDGYFNNKYALPALKKYKIPGVFFISTNNLIYNKSFWWDVLYREEIKNGAELKDIVQEQKQLKLKTSKEIEEYLINKFGEKSLIPKSDIDRPFSVSELATFSKEKNVHLGNHTSNHSILTNHTPQDIKSEIFRAQSSINEITGITPNIISYPNGNYSDEVIKISKEAGIKLGITVEYKKNKLPIDSNSKNNMTLGRFDLSGSSDIIKQCQLFRSDVLLYAIASNFLNKRK